MIINIYRDSDTKESTFNKVVEQFNNVFGINGNIIADITGNSTIIDNPDIKNINMFLRGLIIINTYIKFGWTLTSHIDETEVGIKIIEPPKVESISNK